MVENDGSLWVVHEAEPRVFLNLLATKAALPRHVTQDSLAAALLHTHHLMCLLFCSVQSLLDKAREKGKRQYRRAAPCHSFPHAGCFPHSNAPLSLQDDTAALARASIESVLNHAGQELNTPGSWMHREVRNPLTTLGRAPTAPLSTGATLDTHALCHRAQLAEHGGERLVADAVVAFKRVVLWSSLPAADTARLGSVLGSGILEPSPLRTGPGGVRPGGLAARNMQRLPSGFVVMRPEPSDGSSGSDSPAPGAPGVAAAHSYTLPFVYDTSCKRRHLLAYSSGEVMLLLLMAPGQETPSEAALAAILAAVAAPARQLAARVAEEAQVQSGGDLGHLPGWRFAVREEGYVWASPRSKVSAMTHHARAVGTAVMDSLSRSHPEAVAGGADAPDRPEKAQSSKDAGAAPMEDSVDVLVRSSHGVWAVARSGGGGGRKLALVLREKRLEERRADELKALEDSLQSLDII